MIFYATNLLEFVNINILDAVDHRLDVVVRENGRFLDFRLAVFEALAVLEHFVVLLQDLAEAGGV